MSVTIKSEIGKIARRYWIKLSSFRFNGWTIEPKTWKFTKCYYFYMGEHFL